MEGRDTKKLTEVGLDRYARTDGTARRDPARGISIDHKSSKIIADGYHAVDTVKREIDPEK